jgi:hypothetical protein
MFTYRITNLEMNAKYIGSKPIVDQQTRGTVSIVLSVFAISIADCLFACELQMWASKFHPIVEKSLQLHFTVDPVGNQLM